MFFLNFEPVHCSTVQQLCCFLTCIQVAEEAGKVVCYAHLSKKFPLSCDPDKGFSVVSEAEIDVFLEFTCFFL